MPLANGRETLAIPGPSVMPDRVLRAMHRAAPNIYEGELVDMMPGMVADLKAVARTKGHVAIYISNGHGAWEAAVANTHNRGDKALVLATGSFAKGWAGMATAMGVDCEIVDFGRESGVDLVRLAEVLAADKDHQFKSVLLTQVDTSSSVRSDVPGIRRVLDEAGHPALLMVDCIACLGSDRFEMDAWGVDVTVAGCQKGLMTPPGLGFVFFNAKADAMRDHAEYVSSYWDWRPRTRPEALYQYFCGTAPTHHLFGLREALDMIGEEGLENIWNRHETLARAVWAAFEAWGLGGPARLNVANPAERSHAVTTVSIGAPKGTQLRHWVTEHAGLTLGLGLNMGPNGERSSDSHFRIAHMGHVNSHMLLGTLATIESALIALDVPHGPGGVSAAAKICAV